MNQADQITIFEQSKVRTVWDDEQEKWLFSVVDVVGVLTDQIDVKGARNYWKVLKHRLVAEGIELVTICNQLKMAAADGKKYLTVTALNAQTIRAKKIE